MDQHKIQYENRQKAQAAQMAQQTAVQPGANNTGMTPNMLLQMMQMMNNGGNNPAQNTMMMAAMQNMMQQMNINNNQAEVPTEEPKPEPAFTAKPDTSNGAFKSLFNNAANSAGSGTATRKSDLGGAPQTNSFNAFGASSMPETAHQRSSEPANPFNNFGTTPSAPTPPTTTTEPNNMFNAGFSNSGWSGGDNNQMQNPAQPPPSNNPFDMFK